MYNKEVTNIDLISEDELSIICSRLHKKITHYFDAALKNELRKVLPKKITDQKMNTLLCYALGMLNADFIIMMCKITEDATISTNMMDTISKLTQQVVYDFYSANKERFHKEKEH